MAPPVFRRLRGLALTEVQRLQDHVGDTLDAVRALLNNGLTFASNFAAQVLTLKVTMPDDWVVVGAVGSPPFQNGWSAWGDPSFWAPAFRKTADGVVEMRGLAKGPAPLGANVSIFTLPSAYLPAKTEGPFAVAANADSFATAAVYADGSVQLRAGGAAAGWLSLHQLHFAAADRTPPAQGSPFPLTVVLDRGFAGTPTHIWVTRAVESTGLLVPNVRLDWSPATVGRLTAVQINAAHGLAPLRTYTVTAVVTSG